MIDLMQHAGTHYYFQPVDRTHFERNSRFLTELRRASTEAESAPRRRGALAARIGGALGLF